MTDTHNSAEGWLYDMPEPGEIDAGDLAPYLPPFCDSWAIAGAIQEGKVHTPAEVAARVRLRAVVAFLLGVIVGAVAVSLWG